MFLWTMPFLRVEITLGCPVSCFPLAPRHGKVRTCKCRFIHNALSSTVTSSTFWTCLETGTRHHSAISGMCVGVDGGGGSGDGGGSPAG